MAFEVKKVEQTGGGWIKPEEYADAEALLIELKSFERQRPTDYGPKDSAVVDLTVFATQADIDAGVPTEIRKDTRLEGKKVLTGAFAGKEEGYAIVQKIGRGKKAPGKEAPWLYFDVTDAALNGVIKYGEAREAAIEAALADVPDFD